MPPAKRKSDDPTHESRLAYEERSAAEDNDAAAGPFGGFARADAATLASRRTVAVAAAASDGSSSSSAANRARSYRERMYRLELAHLNKSFAEWARHEKAKLLASGPTAPEYAGPAVSYLPAATEYRRRAAEIKARYTVEFGDVLTMGTGDCGQLGWPQDELNLDATFKRPQEIRNLRNCRVIQVACGGMHNAAVTDDGKVYTWGMNDEGSLGQFTFDPSVEKVSTAYTPSSVTGFVPSPKPRNLERYDDRPDESIVQVATGDAQTLFLSSAGNVFFCGSYKDKDGKNWRDVPPSDDTRLAYEVNLRTAEQIEDNTYPPKPPKGKQFWPIHVNRIPGKATHIDCGVGVNVALLETGGDETKPQLVTWGLADCGELGRPLPNHKRADGSFDMAAVDQYLKPAPPVFDGPQLRRKVVGVGCGGYHFIVVVREYDDSDDDVDASGGILAVYTAGLNSYGQLGRGDGGNTTELQDKLGRVDACDGLNITKVAGGMYHTLALDDTRRNLYGWGRMDSGQMGTTPTMPKAGTFENYPVPIYLRRDEHGNPIKPNPVIAQIACGGNNNLVLTEEGEVYTWGYGENASLGHGVEEDEYQPRRLLLMAGVVRQQERMAKKAQEKQEWDAMTEEQQKAAAEAKKAAKKAKEEEEAKWTDEQRRVAREEKRRAKKKEDARLDELARLAESSATVQQLSGGGQHSALIVTRNVGPAP